MRDDDMECCDTSGWGLKASDLISLEFKEKQGFGALGPERVRMAVRPVSLLFPLDQRASNLAHAGLTF